MLKLHEGVFEIDEKASLYERVAEKMFISVHGNFYCLYQTARYSFNDGAEFKEIASTNLKNQFKMHSWLFKK